MYSDTTMEKAMTNIEVIQEFYRSFREKDDQAFRQICANDLEWIQNEGLPQRAVHKGANAVFEKIFRGNSQEWEGSTYRIEKILDSGSAVVVLGRYKDAPNTPKNTTKAAAHVYEIRDRKICRFRMFADSHLMLEAMSGVSEDSLS